MHFHCEVILPVVEQSTIKATIDNVLEPFREDSTDEDRVSVPFFDWAVVGGRYASEKLLQRLGENKVSAFRQWCRDESITISGIQFGKPSLDPSEQRARVDAKWNEMFPAEDGRLVACPLFEHSNPDNAATRDDICALGQAKHVSCYRVIILGPKYVACVEDMSLDVRFMLAEEVWNGRNYMPVKWDGTISDALRQYDHDISQRPPEIQRLLRPTDEWLTVTVDYHT